MKLYQIDKLERWQFGIDNERLLKLVLLGKKKATCYLYKENGELAKVGELSIITTSDGKDACVVQTEEVQVMPFNEMAWDLAKLEGEHDTLKDWVQDHTNFFRNECENFNEKTLIVFEKFKVLQKCFY